MNNNLIIPFQDQKFKCPVHGVISSVEAFSIYVEDYHSKRRCIKCIFDFLENVFSPLEEVIDDE